VAIGFKLADRETKIDCRSYHLVRSEFVSAESLTKTGISAVLIGDFREILARVAVFPRLETIQKHAKSPINAGALLIFYSPSLVERVGG
jgi:hypothetical protein